MSQFFGFISFDKRADLPEIAGRMKAGMDYFLPDSEDEILTEMVFICNKFLHTNPESEQVFSICRKGHLILAASCRLDNRVELAQKLDLQTTQSDYEYILAAYTRWQEDCLIHLIGDFSFIVWDTKDQKLFMAKDQLGIRPLFYSYLDNILYFSTGIPAIKAAFQKRAEFNDLYIAKELKGIRPDVEETFFKDIHRLKPAHYLYFDVNGLAQEKRYWELQPIDISAYTSEAAIYQQLNELFNESVKCRIRSNKKIACQLSGGLDSSAITVLVARNMNAENLHSFSFVLNEYTKTYSEKGIDEKVTQEEIIQYAALNRQNHHPVDSFHFKNIYDQIAHSNKIMGGYANSDSIWQDAVFKNQAKYGITISLSGFPGDECVSNNGSLYYFDFIDQKDLKNLWQFIRDNKLSGVKDIVNYYRFKWKGSTALKYEKFLIKKNLLKNNTYNERFLENKDFQFYPSFKEILKNKICRTHTSLRCESEAAYALQYRIETAYPLADIRLIQFVYSLPAGMFKPKPFNRAIFRNMCEGLLPDPVRLQQKNNGAFALAFAEYWLKKQFEEFKVKDISNYKGMFNETKYQKQIKDFEAGKTNFPPLLLHYLSEFITLNS